MTHQEEGVEFLLSHHSGLLAFEQGLGKTLVAIEAFQRLRGQRKVDHLVVICPNSLKHTWANELARHSPSLSFRIINGSVHERRALISSAQEHVLIINYEAARKDITPVRAYLRSRRCALVLDESHLAKNRLSLNATAATHFAELTSFRWLLTGTPVTNTPADVYSQIHLVADGQPLGTFGYFMATLGENTAALAEKIKPHVLRRTKEECLDLPDKTFVDLVIPLPAWQRRLYDDARDGLLHEVERMTSAEFRAFAPNALTKLLRLAQIASNPRLIFEGETRTPAKHAELDHLLAELIEANNRKVILWTYYVDTIKAFIDRFKQYGVVSLFGETPSEDRQAIATRFQHDADTKLLVANPAAAGTGFTLTAASYAIYESLTWRFDLYAQSQDRNHRIGQTLPVTYLRLLAEDTIDTAILEALHRKAQLGPQLLGDATSQHPVLDLTHAQFCELLTTNQLPTSHA